MPRLSTVQFSIVLGTVIALFASGIVAGAAGSAIILGAANDAGVSNTTIKTTSSGMAMQMNNLGTGVGGFFLSTSGVGLAAQTSLGSKYAGSFTNQGGSDGGGAAILATGKSNYGIVATSDTKAPIKVTAPGGVAPFEVNSTTAVTNLNADLLDGLNSSQFIRSDVAVEGLFNCVGSVMQSPNSSANFSLGGNGRYLLAGTASFNCGVLLPDGATVTALRAGIRDAVTNGSVACDLLRAPLFLYDTDPDWMAAAASDHSAAPGDLTAEDLTISFAVIDNDAYSYWVSCFISAATSDLTLNGVSVAYSFEGLPLP